MNFPPTKWEYIISRAVTRGRANTAIRPHVHRYLTVCNVFRAFDPTRPLWSLVFGGTIARRQTGLRREVHDRGIRSGRDLYSIILWYPIEVRKVYDGRLAE